MLDAGCLTLDESWLATSDLHRTSSNAHLLPLTVSIYSVPLRRVVGPRLLLSTSIQQLAPP